MSCSNNIVVRRVILTITVNITFNISLTFALFALHTV
jgi:hypothetical protein